MTKGIQNAPSPWPGDPVDGTGPQRFHENDWSRNNSETQRNAYDNKHQQAEEVNKVYGGHSARSRIPVRNNRFIGQLDPDMDSMNVQKISIDRIKMNKHLLANMKDSIFELNRLSEGLTKHVADVTKQHKAANQLWADLDRKIQSINETVKNGKLTPLSNEVTKMKRVKKRELKQIPRNESPLSKLVLPKIETASNGFPLLIQSSDSVIKMEESDTLNKAKMSNIKKIAMEKTQEKRVGDVLPSHHNKAQVQLNPSTGSLAKQSQYKKQLKMERKRLVAKKLREMEEFQDKYILQPNKGKPKKDRHLQADEENGNDYITTKNTKGKKAEEENNKLDEI